MSSKFRCYQAAETVSVVVDEPESQAGTPDAVVIISRAVGDPRARALMRLCAAMLNGDELAAHRELDDFDFS